MFTMIIRGNDIVEIINAVKAGLLTRSCGRKILDYVIDNQCTLEEAAKAVLSNE